MEVGVRFKNKQTTVRVLRKLFFVELNSKKAKNPLLSIADKGET